MAKVATPKTPKTPNPPRSSTAPAVARPSVPTLIEFVVDETGSMGSYVGGTISGFNTFLDEQKAQPGEARFTLTKFSTSNVITPYQDLDLSMVVPMTTQTFLPGGGTNLYDAIGSRIAAIKARIADWTIQPRVLVMVLTDGEDNMNCIYQPERLREMIAEQTREGWSFHYLGAHARAASVAERLGFLSENIRQFDGAQMHETLTEFSARTTAFRAGTTAHV